MEEEDIKKAIAIIKADQQSSASSPKHRPAEEALFSLIEMALVDLHRIAKALSRGRP